MKKGISLIVLVITIIVMIILAASVVISLNNTGVIDKADYAVQATNIKQVEQLATLAWADAYAAGERDVSKLQQAVDAAMTENNVDTNKFQATASATGVTVTDKSSSGGDSSSAGTTEKLATPTIYRVDEVLTITDSSNKATSYVIYVDGVEKKTITTNTIELDTLGLTDGSYSITAISKAYGYTNSDASTAINYTVIKFTIANLTYYARSAATWEEWVNSAYNTTNANIDSDKVYIGSSYVTTTTSGSTAVGISTKIVAGTAYGTYTNGAADMPSLE